MATTSTLAPRRTAKRRSPLLLVASALLVCACSGPDPIEQASQAEFHYKLANNHFYEQQVIMALRELTTCLKLNPDHPDAHHLMGFIFFGRKEYAESEQHFRRALALRGGFHEARANLGALLMATRRWAEAIEVLEPLVNATLYATPWVVHNNMGYSYMQLGKGANALKHFRMALFHNPKFCLGYNNIGTLYQKQGDTELAIDYLKRATGRCNRYAEPHFHLGEIYTAMGMHAEAASEFKECFQDAPESPVGRRCRMRIM